MNGPAFIFQIPSAGTDDGNILIVRVPRLAGIVHIAASSQVHQTGAGNDHFQFLAVAGLPRAQISQIHCPWLNGILGHYLDTKEGEIFRQLFYESLHARAIVRYDILVLGCPLKEENASQQQRDHQQRRQPVGLAGIDATGIVGHTQQAQQHDGHKQIGRIRHRIRHHHAGDHRQDHRHGRHGMNAFGQANGTDHRTAGRQSLEGQCQIPLFILQQRLDNAPIVTLIVDQHDMVTHGEEIGLDILVIEHIATAGQHQQQQHTAPAQATAQHAHRCENGRGDHRYGHIHLQIKGCDQHAQANHGHSASQHKIQQRRQKVIAFHRCHLLCRTDPARRPGFAARPGAMAEYIAVHPAHPADPARC